MDLKPIIVFAPFWDLKKGSLFELFYSSARSNCSAVLNYGNFNLGWVCLRRLLCVIDKEVAEGKYKGGL